MTNAQEIINTFFFIPSTLLKNVYKVACMTCGFLMSKEWKFSQFISYLCGCPNMMDHSINTKRKIYGGYDSTSDDEEQLIDDEINSDNPTCDPSIIYKLGSLKDR